MPSLMSFLRRRAGSLAKDERGSINILFAFSVIPLVGMVGLGVDYSVAQSVKHKLDNAADSAAIAAVATAKAYIAAHSADSNADSGAIAAGLDRAKRAFIVNAGTVAYSQVPTPTITLVRTNQTFSSSVTYATTTQNNFGQMFGVRTMNVGGKVTASADIPSYLDFYLLVDVSGSMGLPATSEGQKTLAGMNTKSPDPFPSAPSQGCQFACHFPGYHGWTLATTNGIQLRSGAVNTAVCALLAQAGKPAVLNQYRVGIYPFITMMGTLSALSSDLTNAKLVSDCASTNPLAFTKLLDTGTTQQKTGSTPDTGTGSGGTHFDTVMTSVQSVISKGAGFGDGSSSSKSRPFVFIITDGMANYQYFGSYQNNTWNYPGSPSTFSGYNSANFTGSTPQAINPALCDALKKTSPNPVTISILYIPYTPIDSSVDPYNEIVPASKAAPTLADKLTSCASPGFFRTANSPADITAALNAMFQQAIQVAHLKQ